MSKRGWINLSRQLEGSKRQAESATDETAITNTSNILFRLNRRSYCEWRQFQSLSYSRPPADCNRHWQTTLALNVSCFDSVKSRIANDLSQIVITDVATHKYKCSFHWNLNLICHICHVTMFHVPYHILHSYTIQRMKTVFRFVLKLEINCNPFHELLLRFTLARIVFDSISIQNNNKNASQFMPSSDGWLRAPREVTRTS